MTVHGRFDDVLVVSTDSHEEAALLLSRGPLLSKQFELATDFAMLVIQLFLEMRQLRLQMLVEKLAQTCTKGVYAKIVRREVTVTTFGEESRFGGVAVAEG